MTAKWSSKDRHLDFDEHGIQTPIFESRWEKIRLHHRNNHGTSHIGLFALDSSEKPKTTREAIQEAWRCEYRRYIH